MEKQEKTHKMIRQRKFMLILPLIALPFITLMFWSLGGGRASSAEAKSTKQIGFNVKLPDAGNKDENWPDKMSYYDQAKLDSLKFQELIKNDPDYKNLALPDSAGKDNANKVKFPGMSTRGGVNTSLYGSGSNDPNANKIYKKLAELDRQMKTPTDISYEKSAVSPGSQAVKANNPMNTGDVNRLEQMMHSMTQPDDEDPEMQQLNGMLEKILDIQHPGRAEEKLKQTSESKRGQVFAVTGNAKAEKISLLQTSSGAVTSNGFYSIDDNAAASESQNAVEAVIHETQIIVNGSTVKLRLLNDVFIDGVQIPKDNFLFGIASLNGERLGIKIGSIRFDNSLYPVELNVHDMDGLDGIYIPGAIARDVAKESADRSMQSLGVALVDPSWGSQAASAGIEAAKSLFSKKVKLTKVTVKAGYKVLLLDEKQNQSI